MRVPWLVTVTLLVASLGACDDGGSEPSFPLREPRPSPTEESGPVVGVIGSLDPARDNDLFEGAQVAVQVLNRQRPPGDEPFDLAAPDLEGDVDAALELIEELAASDRTVGIVYGGPPEAAMRAEPILAEAGIPLLVCYGDLYSARRLSPHVFQVAPPLLWQARRIAPYLLDDRDYGRIGMAVSRSVDGRSAVASLRGAVRDRGGGRVVRVERYGEDVAEVLPGLERAGVQAIVYEGGPAGMAALQRALRGAAATYRSSRTARAGARPGAGAGWRPQVVGFDGAIAPSGRLGVGTVAAESYARGTHYLPIPSFRDFREAFMGWWDEDPVGWERRAYEAGRLIGWAYRKARPGDDLATTLERLKGERFGGLDVTFGPDDHTVVEPTTLGLWVVPRRAIYVRERTELPDQMPWVPLFRTFSTSGRRTDVREQDWRYLFRSPPPPKGPAPRPTRTKFGVTTSRRDPVH